MLQNKNIPDGLGIAYDKRISVGMGYHDNASGNDVTVNSYWGGEFSERTGMYVDASNRLTIVINMQGKLEAPVFFGNTWEAINTGSHEQKTI